MSTRTKIKICPDCGRKFEASVYGRTIKLCPACAKKRNKASWKKSHEKNAKRKRVPRITSFNHEVEKFYEPRMYGAFLSTGKVGLQYN